MQKDSIHDSNGTGEQDAKITNFNTEEEDELPPPIEPVIVYGPNDELLMGIGCGVGLRFMQSYFPHARCTLRIASSYFKLDAYNRCCSDLDKSVEIQVLVGQGQQEKNHLAETIASQFKEKVEGELGRTTSTVSSAVQNLLNRIERKQFKIRGARQVSSNHVNERFKWARFHCKFYVCDDALVLRGSANFTTSGLDDRGNDEGIESTSDPSIIQGYLSYFNSVYGQADDLLKQLENILKNWLSMASPFDAYLKTLHCWYGQEFPKLGPDGHEPTYYQQAVIVRAVEQTNKNQGVLILVATGLGKTIIGSEIARRLTAFHAFKRVVIIAPRVVEKQWKKQLRSRGLPVDDFFDNGALFKSDIEDDLGQKQSLLRRLEECNDETVLLVDESHRYRKVLLKEASSKQRTKKRNKDEVIPEEDNRVIKRLGLAAAKGAKVILLTATPYGTDLLNVNSLLHLLPHNAPVSTSPPKNLFDHPDQRPVKNAWSVSKIEEIATLPVVTILGMFHVLQVACARMDVEGDRVFIAMPNKEKHYLPKKISLYRISYPLFLEHQISDVYDKKAFDAKRVPLAFWSDLNERAEIGTSDASKNNALYAWQSSPREMARVVRFCRDADDRPIKSGSSSKNAHVYQTEMEHLSPPENLSREELYIRVPGDSPSNSRYKADFTLSKRQREKLFTPLLREIEAILPENDPKFKLLISKIQNHQNDKIIIFVKRHSTALYLLEECSKFLPTRNLACTVAQKVIEDDDGSKDELVFKEAIYHLKTNRERERIVIYFAPESNKELISKSGSQKKQFDMLICTDADGIGLNMQDACVVINYDLPTGADELLQRAGRITRMTKDPGREIFVYSFVPDVKDRSKSTLKKIGDMTDKLLARHESSKDIIGGGGILPAETDENPVVIPLQTREDIERIPKKFSPIEDLIPSDQDSMLSHFARWDKYKERKRVSGPVLSAKNITGKHPLIFVMVEGNVDPFRPPFYILYNLQKQRVESRSLEKALDLVWSEEQEEKAVVSAEVVEAASIEALRAWWRLEHPSKPFPEFSEEFNRVCSIYLKPQQKLMSEDAIGNMFTEQLKQSTISDD